MRKIVFLGPLIALTSCNRLKEYDIDFVYPKGESLSHKTIQYYKGGEIKRIDDNDCEHNSFGNSFGFSKDGKLLQYGFLTRCNQAPYLLYFDSLGHYLKTEDDPIAYQDVLGSKDSMCVKWYYSFFLYEQIDIQISQDGKTYYKPQLVKEPYKYVYSTNYCASTDTLQRFFVITKFTGYFLPTQTKLTFYDTVDYSRNTDPINRTLKGPNGEAIYTSPNGGNYYLRNGNEVYLGASD